MFLICHLWYDTRMSNYIKLYDYQQTVVDTVIKNGLDGNKNQLLVAPTGAGKSVMATYLAQHYIKKGETILAVVSGRSLVSNLYKQFDKYGLNPKYIMADMPLYQLGNLYCMSIHTYAARRNRILDLIGEDVSQIYIDELHLAMSSMYQQLYADFPDVPKLGLTGTPLALGLKEMFPTFVYSPSYTELIKLGRLIPVEYKILESNDESKLVVGSNGEYTVSSNENSFSEVVKEGTPLKMYKEHINGMQTVIYCSSVAHAVSVAENFGMANIPTACVYADTDLDERNRIFDEFKAGKIKVITNHSVLGIGVDLPNIEAQIYLREIRSVVDWVQMIGRGIRAHDGIQFLTVLDLAHNVRRHGDIITNPPDWETLNQLLELGVSDLSSVSVDNQNQLEQKEQVVTCPNCQYSGLIDDLVKAGKYNYRTKVFICPKCNHEYRPKRRIKPLDVLKTIDGKLIKFSSLSHEQKAQLSTRWENRAYLYNFFMYICRNKMWTQLDAQVLLNYYVYGKAGFNMPLIESYHVYKKPEKDWWKWMKHVEIRLQKSSAKSPKDWYKYKG